MAQQNNRFFPEGEELKALITSRKRRGWLFRMTFLASLIVAIVVLVTLLYNVIDSVFGFVAVENRIEPAELVAFVGADEGTTLEQLSKENLIAILGEYEPGQARRLESEQLFYAGELVFLTQEQFDNGCAREEPFAACLNDVVRNEADIIAVIQEIIVEPKVHETWSLGQSLFATQQVSNEFYLLSQEHPNSRLEFKSWISGKFITSPQSPQPEVAGVRTAILGSLWVIAITVLFSFPIGVGTAIYLEEYSTGESFLERVVQTNISNLAGVPSIIYGLLGVAVFVFALEAFSSGEMFGVESANGRTIVAAGLTLGLLILPIIIIASQEAIRAVPNRIRQASYGLGATKWQTIWNHVLPSAFPGIMTGTILAMSRAIGETAPLVVVGASTFIRVDPNGPFSQFTVLPIQIYQWTSRPQGAFENIAAAAILVLLILLVTLNATAVLLRNRYSRKAA